MSKKFYSSFIKEDFLTKEASEKAVSGLTDISADILEKLAEEINVAIEEKDVATLEEKIAEDCSKKPEGATQGESTEEGSCSAPSEEKKEETKKEDEEAKEATEETTEEAKKEDKEEEETKEAGKSTCATSEEPTGETSSASEEGSSDETKTDETKTDEKTDEDLEEEQKEEIVKKAYEVAEERLASAGVSLEEYVYEKTANEDVSSFVAENAEKLAFVSEKPLLQVADDLIDSIYERVM